MFNKRSRTKVISSILSFIFSSHILLPFFSIATPMRAFGFSGGLRELTTRKILLAAQQSLSPEIKADQILNILGNGRSGLGSRLFRCFLDAGIDPEGEDELGALVGVAGVHA